MWNVNCRCSPVPLGLVFRRGCGVAEGPPASEGVLPGCWAGGLRPGGREEVSLSVEKDQVAVLSPLAFKVSMLFFFKPMVKIESFQSQQLHLPYI